MSTAWREQQHGAGDAVPAVPDREAVEAGEPVEHRQPREQEQLDEHQVGAEQAAQPRGLGQHAGGARRGPPRRPRATHSATTIPAFASASRARSQPAIRHRVARTPGVWSRGPPRSTGRWYGCGMDGPELTAVPAITLVRLIMERAVSAVEVVETYLRRIDAVGATVNAVVQVDGERALAAARAADARLASGAPDGLLHGVPFTAKDNLEAAGLPMAIGVPERRARRARPRRDRGRPAAGGRRDPRRQDELPAVRRGHRDRQRGVRPHEQPVRPGAHGGREQRRRGGRGRRRLLGARRRDRLGRERAAAGALLRARGAQADRRARAR